jgi:putative ABC transport system substrate-binding protein
MKKGNTNVSFRTRMLAVFTAVLMLSSIGQTALADTKEITMVVWRGCEEACQGFIDYFSEHERTVDITIEDVAKDKTKFESIVKQLNRDKPDLVLTWGTTVSKAILGTIDNETPEAYLQDVPSVFMIVADPVGAKIVKNASESGRSHVTGTLNRVGNDAQLNVIQDYLDAKKIGLIYNEAELNSVLNYEAVNEAAFEQGLTVEGIGLPEKADDAQRDRLLVEAVETLAKADVDVIYVGSSSYLVSKSDLLTETALEYGLGVVTSYESMVRGSKALFSLANRYYNVGKLAGLQAEEILFNGKEPGVVPIRSLARSSLFVNMEMADKLQLYPPIQLLRFAEIIKPSETE